MSKNKAFKDRGFSILEIVIALGILSLVFISLAQSFPFGLSVSKSAENSTLASYLAQEKIEELVAGGYENISIGIVEPKSRISSDPDSQYYFFERETTVAYLDADFNESLSDEGLKRIIVTVYSKGFSKNESSYTISSLIAKK